MPRRGRGYPSRVSKTRPAPESSATPPGGSEETPAAETDRRKLLETQAIAGIGSWDWLPDTNQVTWTPELYRVFGIKPHQFDNTYEGYLSLVHPEDRERVRGIVDNAYRTQTGYTMEHRVLKANGGLIYVSSIGRVYVNDDGRVERMSGTAQDITDRKQREQLLLDRETELRVVVDQMPVVVWTVDKDLCMTSVMGAAMRSVRLDPERLKGKHLFDLIGTQDPTHVTNAAHLKALNDEYSVYLVEVRGRTFRARVGPLRDSERQIIGVIGVALDVTDELRTGNELREAHENYRSLIEAIPAVSYIESISGKSRSLFVSPQSKDIFGIDPSDVDQHTWISLLHPEDKERAIALRRESYRTFESFEDEYRMFGRDGKTLWIRDQAVFVRDEEGNAIFAQGIMYDITERKKLEDQLVQSHKMDAIGRLTGGIAHDFNNLLTAILGNCYLALEDGDEDSLRSALEEVRETAELGAELVSQLLGFSRRKAVAADVIDLSELVASTKGLLQRVIGEDIVLQTRTSEQPLLVRADTSQLTQVILNLAVNAREAMPNGGLLELDVLHSSQIGESRGFDGSLPTEAHAVLRVSDSGTGMDAATRASMFEPFFTTKERSARSGTGLGMSIVYGIVTRANGYLNVDSKPGLGTKVSVFLPLVAAETPLESAGADIEPVPSQGLVLVVEDDDRVRTIAAQMVSRMGFEVIDAAGPTEALEIARNRKIDVLLTDVVMPELDGPRLAKLVLEEQPNVRVVFMSGYQEAIWDSGSPPPGASFIQKPFRREDLADVLRTDGPDEIVVPEINP